jgi:hypothetical protein
MSGPGFDESCHAHYVIHMVTFSGQPRSGYELQYKDDSDIGTAMLTHTDTLSVVLLQGSKTPTDVYMCIWSERDKAPNINSN